MQEQLITFETAKLAKEKGFDIRCTHGYDTFEEGHIRNGELRNLYDNYHGDYSGWKNSESSQSSYVTAPRQSLLQKWIREIHKIDVFCDCIGSGKYYSVIYDNSIKEGNDKVFEQEKETSYEEALEIGLREALELIEIVKENK